MNNMDSLIKSIKNDFVYIQTHNFPDPDAIASAFGLSELLKTYNIKSKIVYSGLIDRSSTIKMVDLLGIELFNIKYEDEINSQSQIILVDSQPGNSNVNTSKCMPAICIDHHPMAAARDCIFSDIRPGIGSCSSIVAQYCIENGVTISSRVATALIYGIKVDTANFTRNVSDIDLDMFYRLYKMSNKEILHSIESNTLDMEDLDAFSKAIKSIRITDVFSFAEAPMNCAEALIATISDFMLALSDIHLSVVFAIKSNGIKLSVRSDDATLDSGKICMAALEGIGDGGGHAAMAGGFVPFNPDASDSASHIENIINQIEQNFIEAYKENKRLVG